MNFRTLTEKQIIQRAKEYQERIEKLESKISEYLSGNQALEREIREEYKKVKSEISSEAKHFDSEKNSIEDISNIHSSYQCGIMESAAHGFEMRSNGKISQEMFNSLEEAEYRLTKYLSDFEEWEE